jgi:hypothetical protein
VPEQSGTVIIALDESNLLPDTYPSVSAVDGGKNMVDVRWLIDRVARATEHYFGVPVAGKDASGSGTDLKVCVSFMRIRKNDDVGDGWPEHYDSADKPGMQFTGVLYLNGHSDGGGDYIHDKDGDDDDDNQVCPEAKDTTNDHNHNHNHGHESTATFTGGDFHYTEGQTVLSTVTPEPGLFNVWTSGRENYHKVDAVSGGERYSIVFSFDSVPRE